MNYGRCKNCDELRDRNADGYCTDCASFKQASGLGGVKLHYGTCTICGKPKKDLNSDDICGSCRAFYNQ